MRQCLLSIAVLCFNLSTPLVAGEAPKLGTELVLDCGSGVSLKLVYIPAGKFQRLNENDSESGGKGKDKGPKTHTVTISKPFFIGIHEVTQEQYQSVMGVNPVATGNSENTGLRNPVTMMVWPQAVEFCKKLSEKTGRVVRLPSEGEWEYAARAGTTADRYFGMDTEECNDHAWMPANAGGHKTHPVGELKPNPWGLYDVLGNVWEMTSDWYYIFDNKDVVDPKSPDTPMPPRKNFHVTRGGSFYAGIASVLGRYGYPDHFPKRHIGFRVVVEPN